MRIPFRNKNDKKQATDPLVEIVETVRNSSLFDASWYCQTYPDVVKDELDPADHYVRVGANEGRNPGPGFDTTWYFNENPDIVSTGYNPLFHYLAWGADEGRTPAARDGVEAFESAIRARRSGARGIYPYSQFDNLYSPSSLSLRGPELQQGLDPATQYERWVWLYDTLTEEDRSAIRFHVERFKRRPLISVVMPVYNTPPKLLQAAILSVRKQLYPDWELCIADDASTDPVVAKILNAQQKDDPRIKWVRRAQNGHISACTNSALDLATGDFVAFMDHDDLLPERALYEVAAQLDRNADLDLIFSDEDQIDNSGRRHTPTFKGAWNPELMLSYNQINHLSVYRRSVIERIGGLRVGFEGSQDYDLALRAMRVVDAKRIQHIPAVLYHWRRDADDPAFSEAFLERCIQSARRSLAEYLSETGQHGVVSAHPTIAMWHRVKRDLPEPPPRVSIIVPTRDKPELIGRCIDGLLHRTDYGAMEILIVDNETVDAEALALLDGFKADSRVRVLPYHAPFNYSAMNNFAARQARGDYLLLLNNDVDVIEPHWLAEMMALVVLDEVGAVGAKLLYPDGRVQHAGVILGPGGVAGHYFDRADRDEPGYAGRALVPQQVSAVTAACLLVRKALFEEVGGLDEVNLPVSFNDVDLCLRIGRKGYRNIWTPYAELFHHESASRGSDARPEHAARVAREVAYMFSTWSDLLPNDPFYNPNLSLLYADFTLACPPRRARSWAASV